MSNHRRKDLLNCKCGAKATIFKQCGEVHRVYCQKYCGQKHIISPTKDQAVIDWNKSVLPTFVMEFKGSFLIHANSEGKATDIFYNAIHQNYIRPMEYESNLSQLTQ